jgi:hypothetical protein
MRQHGGISNWKVVELGCRANVTKREAIKIEEEYRIALKADLNERRCYTSPQDKKEQQKQYRVENREHNKQYYVENRDTLLNYHKQYRVDNRDTLLNYNKQYRVDNKDAIQNYNKQYYINKKKTNQ